MEHKKVTGTGDLGRSPHKVTLNNNLKGNFERQLIKVTSKGNVNTVVLKR